MAKRRKIRELAVQALFAVAIGKDNPEATFDLICDNFIAEKGTRPLSKQLFLGVCSKRDILDELIAAASKHWRIERMPLVDLSILRLAVFEMIFVDDVPPKVAIDEALEIGKKFGSEKSVAFLNGVLDRVYKDVALR